ncbi:ROK family protein, partial [Streptomyces acidiscabies]|uniref:ROK family protein n=1 Tax=Streptomyces acidiscabies TaxID=42234 RepID=UPI000AFBB182
WAVERLAGEFGVVGEGAAGVVRGAVEAVAAPEAADAPGDEATNPADIPVPEPAALFLDALADRIALGVASVVAVLDPGCVVLGGEVGQAGGGLLAGKVEARIRRMAPLVTEVRASALGGGAVLRGALLTAREAAQDELFGAS